MKLELHELIEKVSDEKSFLIFVQALIEDRSLENPNSIDIVGRGSRGWENHSIETFLEAAHAWAESCLLYTSPSPRDGLLSRMPSSA